MLWTVGLFVVAGIIATDMLFRFAGFPRFFHGLFMNVPVAGTVAVAVPGRRRLQVRRALAALARLRAGLSRVHAGDDAARRRGVSLARCSRSSTTSTRCWITAAETVRRALSRAGDLAHGLKTPLAVIAREAERGAARPAARRRAAAAGGPDAPADRLPPGPRPRGGVGRHARRLGERGGVGVGAGAHARASCTPSAA